MTDNAILIPIEGEATAITLPEADHTRLQAMYKAIGCSCVEVFQVTSTLTAWVDEEGMWSKPVNPSFMQLAQRYGQLSQALHGAAILTGAADEDGGTLDLTPEQIDFLLSTINQTP